MASETERRESGERSKPEPLRKRSIIMIVWLGVYIDHKLVFVIVTRLLYLSHQFESSRSVGLLQ